jgi:hypothetical protein
MKESERSNLPLPEEPVAAYSYGVPPISLLERNFVKNTNYETTHYAICFLLLYPIIPHPVLKHSRVYSLA